MPGGTCNSRCGRRINEPNGSPSARRRLKSHERTIRRAHRIGDRRWTRDWRSHGDPLRRRGREGRDLRPRSRRGKMVFLSSSSALGNRGQVNYSAAKAGIQGMARTLAIELGPFNINVNAVAPGFIETRMTQAVAERTGIDYADLKKAASERTPLRRIGRPEDIAGVISFLCSDDASFLTGQTIYATGGP